MESSKKRKRDADFPRISYHTSARAFDRLFQENSLVEMKEVVRRKLKLGPRTSILLAQIRDGKSVDLEDDDDFDAFYALAHSTNSVDVKVTVAEQQDGAPLSTSVTPSKKKKRKRDKGAISEVGGERLYQKPLAENIVAQISKVPLDADSEPQKKKRKTGSDDIEADKGHSISLVHEKSNVENGEIAVQAPKAPLDASGEPRKKKKNKAPGNDSVTKTDTTSRSAPDLLGPSTTSTSLECTSKDVPMTPIQVEDATIAREKLKKARKKQKQEEKPQAGSTLPTSSPSNEGQTSKGKEAHDKNTPSSVQGAKEPIVPVSTKSETHKSLTEHGGSQKSRERNQEKQRKSQKQRAEVNSPVVNEPSYSSQAAAVTKTQLNSQKVDVNEVEHCRVGEKEEDISSVNPKKSRKEPSKLTPDERKAAEADVDAIFAKVLAAKRAAAGASVNNTLPEKHGNVVSSSKSKKKKNSTSASSKSLHPNPTPTNAGVEPSQNAAEHPKPTSGPDRSKLESTCPLCLLSPLHEKLACPLVLGGPESLRERLLELQEAPDDGKSNQEEIISELRELLRLAEETSTVDMEPPLTSHDFQLSHSQNPAPTVTNSLTGDISDKLSPSKNDMPSHTKASTTQTTKPSDTSDSSDDESSSRDNELLSVPHDPIFLDKVNLDDLIRGPVSAAVRIADLDSSDSSEEDEEDKEENQVLEEDEPEVPRRSQRSGGVLDSSDEADSVLDDVQSVTEESQKSNPNGASPQREFLPSSGTDHVSFQAVDRIGESQEVDRSADVAFGVALEMDTTILNPTVVPQGTSPNSATETSQSLAPSSRRANLVNKIEVTPLSNTSTPTAPVGPSTTRPLVSTPLTSLRDSSPAHDTRDEAKPIGIIQRMKTRNGKAPVSEKNPETPTISQTLHTRITRSSQSVQDGVARRTRAATRRETLSTMTPPVPSAKPGRQSRLIRTASQSTEDLNVTTMSQDVMSLDTWATLKPSSPMVDADATIMVDELEPSSPCQHAHMDIDNPNENEGQEGTADDPLFFPSESLPLFPYSQWNDGSQMEIRDKSDKNNHKENEVNTSVQPSRDKPKQSQNPRYRRLTDITSDHGFFSMPTNLRATRSSTAAKKATDMYGRKDEIESESESDSDNSDAEKESHIPKSRRAGTKQTKRK